jgi:hypothetical protein
VAGPQPCSELELQEAFLRPRLIRARVSVRRWAADLVPREIRQCLCHLADDERSVRACDWDNIPYRDLLETAAHRKGDLPSFEAAYKVFRGSMMEIEDTRLRVLPRSGHSEDHVCVPCESWDALSRCSKSTSCNCKGSDGAARED